MTGDRHGWPDDAAAERLLRGGPGGVRDEAADGQAQALGMLLAAAREPVPGSAGGENAALAAFRVARSGAPRTWHRRAMSARTMIGVAVAGLAFGGVAVTAGTVGFSGLPGLDTGRPESSASGSMDPTQQGRPSATAGSTGSPLPGGPARARERELDKLCRSYEEGLQAHGRAGTLDDEALALLADEAGGADKVPDYCADRMAGGAEASGGSEAAEGKKGKDGKQGKEGKKGKTGKTGKEGPEGENGNNGNANSGGNESGNAKGGGNNGTASGGAPADPAPQPPEKSEDPPNDAQSGPPAEPRTARARHTPDENRCAATPPGHGRAHGQAKGHGGGQGRGHGRRSC